MTFRCRTHILQPRSVAGLASDQRTRAPIPTAAPAAVVPPMGLEPNLLRIVPPPIERALPCDAANPAEAQALARVSSSSRSITATGTVDGTRYTRPLLTGLPVLVRGAGRQHSGLYYVTSVTHRISRDDWQQSFRATRNAVGLTGAEIFFDPLAAVG